MPKTEPKLRVLIVDDNRDGADGLGLVVEAFGNQVHGRPMAGVRHSTLPQHFGPI